MLNVMLKYIFVPTANSKPPTANRGLKFAVDLENAMLNVPNMKTLLEIFQIPRALL